MSNPPGTGRCSDCGFPAQFTVEHLRAVNGTLPKNYDVSPIPALISLVAIGATLPIYVMLPDWLTFWIGPREIMWIAMFVVLAVCGLIVLVQKVVNLIRKR